MAARIFICDDDQNIVEVMKIILENEGYEVTTFIDEDLLLEHLNIVQPDLLLLDFWMSKKDGKSIVECIRKDKNLASMKIILISAIASIKEIAKEIPVQGYIEKPFDIDVFTNKVKEVLEVNIT